MRSSARWEPQPAQAKHAAGGTRNLVEAMRRAGMPRLVCVTLLGTAGSQRNTSAQAVFNQGQAPPP